MPVDISYWILHFQASPKSPCYSKKSFKKFSINNGLGNGGIFRSLQNIDDMTFLRKTPIIHCVKSVRIWSFSGKTSNTDSFYAVIDV